MKSVAASVLPLVASLAVLGLVPAALAHGEDMNTGMEMGTDDSGESAKLPEDQYPPTYFSYPEHKSVTYAHISVMVLAWVFMLPVAVMLSIARSRYALASQFLFLATTALGVLLSTIYNASTPDLYPNNAHHKIGWIATIAVCVQIMIALLARIGGALKGRRGQEGRSAEYQRFIPMSTEAMAEHESRFPKPYRLSNDSGQGTERNTESLRSPSMSSTGAQSPSVPLGDMRGAGYFDEEDDEGLDAQIPTPNSSNRVYVFVKKAVGTVSFRTWRALIFIHNFIERTILVLGFITLCTGIIAFGRFFEGGQVFTGLAHWIKGGIFFLFGILTLGRWCGAFGEMGWAWNLRPKQVAQKWRPSAEFVESFLIFFYGSTNIFLEHLGNAGQEFSPQDLEHISITVLFIGGGLCGMLIESTWIRDLLNTTVVQAVHDDAYDTESDREALREPEAYTISLNPIPALVILLLGIMMSSHTQQSMVSSMIHKQWGNMLSGASFARAATYVLMYLRPPRSIYPSRPPTELLTSFGLISGGITFMASSGDTVVAMIHYDLDAMFFFTVTMGLVGLLMAWVIFVMAIKGWAVRKEARHLVHSFEKA